ncbi:MAG: 7TM-DISM domain-containing protein [Polyangiales bacterium]
MRWLALIVVLWASSAEALDVSDLHGGRKIRVELLEDASGALSLAQVRERDFKPSAREEISLGFTRSTYWFRFTIENSSDESREWLLELAYAHLDHIDLYDGAGKHWVTGDMLPFSARPLEHANFVFPQRTRAHANDTLYLRVQTGGALRVPLTAWTHTDFVVRENHENLLLWMFYGAVALLAWYNFSVALVIRRREHAYYGLMLLGIWGSIFSLSGHTAEYLLGEHPLWANRGLAFSLSVAWLAVQFYTREVFVEIGLRENERKFFRAFTPAAALSVAIAIFTPPDIGMRCVLIALALYIPCGYWLLRSMMGRHDPRLKLYEISWYCYIVTMPLALAAHADWVPPWPIALWAGHLGSVAHGVFTSLALPARINELGARLAGLNQQLSSNVTDLKLALSRAEEATEEAQRATQVKDEFMATMSHELRTPLNAIINVPQGLLDDFPMVRSATCGACNVRFLLEDGEPFDAQASCEACGARAFREGKAFRYEGDATHTVRFLQKIERSGKHLLQMVNGVLDFSKMEAGRLELALAELDMHTLLVEVVDEMTDLAERKQLQIALEVPAERPGSVGDALRLKQVLLNLLSNAIKFSEPGTLITVRWQHDEEHDLVSVRDQGIGIKPEDQERVFASFEQVHKGDTRKYGGTGLGLSISRSLVRMHGGELTVASELGKGSTFTFSLPRASFSRAAV